MLAVKLVEPVPPFATFNVPARVTAPAVAVEGVKPVVPPEMVVTATLVKLDHCGAVPLDVRTYPDVPIPSLLSAVPLA